MFNYSCLHFSPTTPPNPIQTYQVTFFFKKFSSTTLGTACDPVWPIQTSYFPDNCDWLMNGHMIYINESKRFHSGIFIGTGEEGDPLAPQTWEEGPIWGCRTKKRKRSLVLVNVQSDFSKSLCLMWANTFTFY